MKNSEIIFYETLKQCRPEVKRPADLAQNLYEKGNDRWFDPVNILLCVLCLAVLIYFCSVSSDLPQNEIMELYSAPGRFLYVKMSFVLLAAGSLMGTLFAVIIRNLNEFTGGLS